VRGSYLWGFISKIVVFRKRGTPASQRLYRLSVLNAVGCPAPVHVFLAREFDFEGMQYSVNCVLVAPSSHESHKVTFASIETLWRLDILKTQ
jgi:hypothetical protein